MSVVFRFRGLLEAPVSSALVTLIGCVVYMCVATNLLICIWPEVRLFFFFIPKALPELRQSDSEYLVTEFRDRYFYFVKFEFKLAPFTLFNAKFSGLNFFEQLESHSLFTYLEILFNINRPL